MKNFAANTNTLTPTFPCSDIGLIAFLRLNGCSVLKSERHGPRLALHFPKNSKTEKLALSFFNRKAKVSPLDYAGALREAKNIIFSELRK